MRRKKSTSTSQDKGKSEKGFLLNDLVEYVQDEVICRFLFDGANSEYALCSYDAGQVETGEPVARDYLIMVMEGEVELDLRSESTSLEKGRTCVIPANERHSLRARTPSKVLKVAIGT